MNTIPRATPLFYRIFHGESSTQPWQNYPYASNRQVQQAIVPYDNAPGYNSEPQIITNSNQKLGKVALSPKA